MEILFQQVVKFGDLRFDFKILAERFEILGLYKIYDLRVFLYRGFENWY